MNLTKDEYVYNYLKARKKDGVACSVFDATTAWESFNAKYPSLCHTEAENVGDGRSTKQNAQSHNPAPYDSYPRLRRL